MVWGSLGDSYSVGVKMDLKQVGPPWSGGGADPLGMGY